MLACFEPFITYWQGLRSGALLPSREDFHPSEVRDFMGRIVIVERLSRSHFLSRLVGTEIVTRLGHEHTGKDFLNLLQTPESRENQLAFYNAMLDQPFGSCGERDIVTNKGTYHAKVLVLPIRHAASHAGEFFAVFEFDQSLFLLSGIQFEHFGALRHHTILDLGAGVPDAYACLPSETLPA
ncbi:PAS domain-containing protein [Kordiimonas aestuarii]|uniref:PAS domain-containing protein n=1 Tax=Kordiimonas aestuarii TaxID=1005925 RepID=UPI0021D2A25D|nr:PAS domain-containing protein [Kordiimonas aestuarii]